MGFYIFIKIDNGIRRNIFTKILIAFPLKSKYIYIYIKNNLSGDKTIMIKEADKGSSVLVWDRFEYLHEASRQLQDQNIYEGVKFNENIFI